MDIKESIAEYGEEAIRTAISHDICPICGETMVKERSQNVCSCECACGFNLQDDAEIVLII